MLETQATGEITTGHCPDCGVAEDRPGRFCANCQHFKAAAPGIKAATYLRRLLAFVLDIILFPLLLIIGYIIWWLIALSNGQTPGKQLLGIRVMKEDGQPSGWGLTFVREFLVEGVLLSILSGITSGIVFVVNYLFPLFDRDRQALHDKMVGTIVVKDA